MGKTGEQITVILLALVGLAALAVLVSRNANTTNVIGAASSGFASALSSAIAPITGGGSGSVL